MLDISVIILTYNEEKHIERCVKNAFRFAKEVVLVDSFSTDNTVSIAQGLGAVVYQNKWENNHAKQLNWGLETIPFTQPWIFRLDADEFLTDELINEIKNKFYKIDNDISGIVFNRKIKFLDKLIINDGMNMKILRMFRTGKAYCENRWMDEHIVLTEGETIEFENFLIDDNKNPLGWWINKHNNYAVKEAIEMLNIEFNLFMSSGNDENSNMASHTQSKRDKKNRYANMPLFWRSFLYFVYRYFFKFGFTQGKEGFLWHFLQGWWYRTLVDAKIYEIKKACGNDTDKMKSYIKANYQIDLF